MILTIFGTALAVLCLADIVLYIAAKLFYLPDLRFIPQILVWGNKDFTSWTGLLAGVVLVIMSYAARKEKEVQEELEGGTQLMEGETALFQARAAMSEKWYRGSQTHGFFVVTNLRLFFVPIARV